MWRTYAAGALLGSTLALVVFALLTLFFERKFIAVAQKRLGISFLGRNGWAHLPADLIKFWFKHTLRFQSSWLSAPVGVVGAILAYFVWSLLGVLFFTTDAGGVGLDSWDLQLVFYVPYASLTALAMFHVVCGTRSKYATLAGARVLLVNVLMEVFFTLSFLMLYARAGGYSFDAVTSLNEQQSLLVATPPLALVFLIYALFEAKRAPFDHSEAESELVAGHLVEFGGRALLFFYMCEYVHVFFCLYLILVFCLGGLSCGVTLFAPFWVEGLGTLN